MFIKNRFPKYWAVTSILDFLVHKSSHWPYYEMKTFFLWLGRMGIKKSVFSYGFICWGLSFPRTELSAKIISQEPIPCLNLFLESRRKKLFPKSWVLAKKMTFFIFKRSKTNKKFGIFKKHIVSVHMGLNVITNNFYFWPSLNSFFTEHSACGKKTKSIIIRTKMIRIFIFRFSPEVTYPDVSLSVKNASSKFSRLGTFKSFALS
jgi:hypothetical protein